MIEQQGQVVSQRGGSLGIRMGATPGCSLCAQGKGCGAGIFGRLLARRPVEIWLPNTISARPGQLVGVGIPESVFLSLLARLYLLPLLAGLAGGGLAHYLGGALDAENAVSDGMVLLGAMLLGGLVLWSGRRTRADFSQKMNLKLLRVVPNDPTGADCPSEAVSRRNQR